MMERAMIAANNRGPIMMERATPLSMSTEKTRPNKTLKQTAVLKDVGLRRAPKPATRPAKTPARDNY